MKSVDRGGMPERARAALARAVASARSMTGEELFRPLGEPFVARSVGEFGAAVGRLLAQFPLLLEGRGQAFVGGVLEVVTQDAFDILRPSQNLLLHVVLEARVERGVADVELGPSGSRPAEGRLSFKENTR